MAVSEQFVVFRQADAIITESLDGARRGSFRVPPRSECVTRAELISKSLLLMTCTGSAVVGFDGKEMRAIPRH